MSITSTPNNDLELDIFDKRAEFARFFPIVRYPNTHSLIPTSIVYGVFTGQLHRFHRVCSHVATFMSNSVRVAHVLMKQGAKLQRLIAKFSEFVHGRDWRWLKPHTAEYQIIAKFKNDVGELNTSNSV